MKKFSYVSLLLLVMLLMTAFYPNGNVLAAEKGVTTITMYSPSGVILDRTPTLSWKRVSGYLYYDIKVMKGTTLQYAKSQIYCSSTFCEYTSVSPLDYEPYTWYVTIHGKDFSTLNMLDFAISSPNFSSGFNGNKAGWARFMGKGGTWIAKPSYVYTRGKDNSWSNLYREADGGQYYDFDYTIRFRRYGGIWSGLYPANCLLARLGGQLNSALNWSPGYRFCITTKGKYKIAYRGLSDYDSHTIQDWKPSSAIYAGSGVWNVLRVKAIGKNFWFYINGTLVRSFSDVSRDHGYIGVIMYKYAGPFTEFDVDYAYLSVITSSSARKEALPPAPKLPYSEVDDQGSR